MYAWSDEEVIRRPFATSENRSFRKLDYGGSQRGTFPHQMIAPNDFFVRLFAPRFRINAYSLNRRVFPGTGRTFSINAVVMGRSSQHSFLSGALPGHFLMFAAALPCSLGFNCKRQQVQNQITRCKLQSCDASIIIASIVIDRGR